MDFTKGNGCARSGWSRRAVQGWQRKFLKRNNGAPKRRGIGRWKGKIMAKRTDSKIGGNIRKQTFAFCAPDALSVQLVGDFTQWQERPVNLHKGLDGVWRATVDLGPGTHHYRFLVDGQWRDDPECILRAPNPYGSENMMRQVA